MAAGQEQELYAAILRGDVAIAQAVLVRIETAIPEAQAVLQFDISSVEDDKTAVVPPPCELDFGELYAALLRRDMPVVHRELVEWAELQAMLPDFPDIALTRVVQHLADGDVNHAIAWIDGYLPTPIGALAQRARYDHAMEYGL